jgi:hypothetical protein
LGLWALLSIPEAVHHVEGTSLPPRHGNGPVDPSTALLEGLQHDDLAGQVNPPRGEGQGFGHPAPGIVQNKA